MHYNDISYSLDHGIGRITLNKPEKINALSWGSWAELENAIAALEADLANLGSQLESPFVKPEEAGKLGTEYERVQKEMDAKLGEWERMQVEI